MKLYGPPGRQAIELVAARAAEAPTAPTRRSQLIDGGHVARFEPDDHQLGNSIAPLEPHLFGRVEVDEQDLYLTSIPRVDQPRSVDKGHPVPIGESRTGQDQACASAWNLNRDARRDTGSVAGGQDEIYARAKVDSGIPITRVARYGKIGVQLLDSELHGRQGAGFPRQSASERTDRTPGEPEAGEPPAGGPFLVDRV